MKKYFILLLITFSVMSFAQFEENTFDGKQSNREKESSSNLSEFGAVSDSDKNDQTTVFKTGNPGEPAPIDDYIPWLLFAGMSIIIYSQRKNKKVNI